MSPLHHFIILLFVVFFVFFLPLNLLTFSCTRERMRTGRMSSFTTASARGWLCSARRPRARAAVCWMLDTTSSISGRSREIAPVKKNQQQQETVVKTWNSRPPVFSNVLSYLRFAGFLCFAGLMPELRPLAQTAFVTSDTARKLRSTGKHTGKTS